MKEFLFQAAPHLSCQPMLILKEEEVRELLRLEDLLVVVEQALIDFSTGRVQQPVRSVLAVPQHNGLWALMPAVFDDVMGAKLVTLYKDNASRGIPTHQATIQLFSSRTGEPLAFMDGRLITELRTAAVSAVATRLLAKPEAHVLAILGSGVQAWSHVRALQMVRNFDQIRVWSRTPEHAQRFAQSIGGRATSREEAVRGADVVVTVSSTREPLVLGEWLNPDAYVNAVGTVGLNQRELDDVAMAAAVVVESRDSAPSESGDLVHSGAAIYAELGELLAKKKPLPSRRVVFKSLGIAATDIAAARLVYLRAVNQ
jgi:ornithine cyclodeaminase/alanine dehydrogenase-like protein (mu-crystallin family)